VFREDPAGIRLGFERYSRPIAIGDKPRKAAAADLPSVTKDGVEELKR